MRKKLFIFISICLIIALGTYLSQESTRGKYYKTYSPDKQYSVYTSKTNWELFSMAMPGNGGDATGKVFLYDEIEGEVIKSAPISILWTAGSINWNDSIAYFYGEENPTILEPWNLPRPISKSALNENFNVETAVNKAIFANIIDLDIYTLGSFQKNDSYIPFVSLTDMFSFNEHKDSTVIADKYLAEDNTQSYHTLSPKYRSRFLKQKQISESDHVFIYNYETDKMTTYLVKEVPLFAHITIYDSETVVPQYYYLIGFNFEGKKAFKNWTYTENSFLHIGEKNPFTRGQMKPFGWTNPTEIPLEIQEKESQVQIIDLNQVYTFVDNEMKFFYFPTLQNLFVLDAKSKKIIYNKKFYTGEGSSLAPLNYMNKNYPNEVIQWTGKLFKDYPPVFFGFVWQSFSCEGIDVIQPPLTIIPILCDNRH